MEGNRPFRVALSDVAIQLISAIPRARQYVFLGGKIDKPLSDNAMLSVLRRMERTDVTVHGFRSTFRDYIGEETGLFIVIHNHETRRKQMSNKKLPKKPQLSGSRDRLHCCGIPILCFYRKIAKRSWFQAHQARLRGVNVWSLWNIRARIFTVPQSSFPKRLTGNSALHSGTSRHKTPTKSTIRPQGSQVGEGFSRKLSVFPPACFCVLGKGGGDIGANRQWILQVEIVNLLISISCKGGHGRGWR